jgi:hypothetical protein
VTTLTLITLVVALYGLFNARGYGRALALGGATPTGAALVLSDTLVVPTFYAVALGTVVALFFPMLGRGPAPPLPRRHLPPGADLLLMFFLWSTFVTVAAPLLFNGLPVLLPGGKESTLIAGVVSGTNAAQLIYLALAVCIVVFLGRSPHTGPQLLGLAVGLTVMLSMWRFAYQNFGVPFPEGLLDNSPAFAYIDTAPGGAPRFRGILSEPASLAISCLVAIVYMLPRSFQARGWRRVGCLVVACSALFLGVISTSATFVVAGAIMAVIVALTFLFGFLIRRTSVGRLASVVACVLVIVAIWVLPFIATYVELTISDKVGSSSYSDRSDSDAVAYEALLNTFGLGAGVGASRASSFFPGLLSATGVIGTLLFAAMVTTLIRRSSALREYHPVIWALVSVLVVKIVSGPDLSDPSGVLWISLGLLSHGALVAGRSRPGADAAGRAPGATDEEHTAVPLRSAP